MMSDKNICSDKVYQYSLSTQLDDYTKLAHLQKIQKITKAMMKHVKAAQVLSSGTQKDKMYTQNTDCYLSTSVFYFRKKMDDLKISSSIF